MENIYVASRTIMLFLIIMLVIQTFFGDKMAQNMALVILFSMLVLNSKTIADFTESITEQITN